MLFPLDRVGEGDTEFRRVELRLIGHRPRGGSVWVEFSRAVLSKVDGRIRGFHLYVVGSGPEANLRQQHVVCSSAYKAYVTSWRCQKNRKVLERMRTGTLEILINGELHSCQRVKNKKTGEAAERAFRLSSFHRKAKKSRPRREAQTHRAN